MNPTLLRPSAAPGRGWCRSTGRSRGRLPMQGARPFRRRRTRSSISAG